MPTDLHPDYPVVTGDYLLTAGWRLVLPEKFNRRIEDGSLVLWMPELTFWINAWNNDQQISVDEQLALILTSVSPERRDERIEKSATATRLSYELAEEDPDASSAECHSVCAYVISARGYLQISAYFDSPPARALAYKIIASIRAEA
ncbi:MAG: hypothetical protein V4857_21045 [Pseudomonadota bacterium]